MQLLRAAPYDQLAPLTRYRQLRIRLLCVGMTIAILAGMGLLLTLTLRLAEAPHLDAIRDGRMF